MIALLFALLSVWPEDWYREYSEMNWEGMLEISSLLPDSGSISLAVKAVSMMLVGVGDPLRTAESAVASDRTDYHAWTAVAFVGMREDSAAMDSVFSTAFSLVHEDDPVLLETYAYWLFSIGQKTEAETYSFRAIRADSSFAPAWETAIRVLLGENKHAKAISVASEAVRRFPDCAPVLYQYGRALQQSGDAGAAISAYAGAFEKDSSSVNAASDLAILLRDNKRNGEAIKVLRRMLRVFPEYGWAWGELASSLEEEGRPDLADSFFRKAVELSPEDSWVLYRLARLESTDNPDYATELLERAVQLSPDYRQAWQELVFLYELADDLEKAEHAIEKCIELAAEPWMYGELGWILESMGKYDEALQKYEIAVSMDSQYLYGWQRRGALLLLDGEDEAARESFEEALDSLEADDPWILRELGKIAVERAEMDTAGLWFLRALKSEPQNSQSWLDLARIQRLQGNAVQALASLDNYLSVEGDSAIAVAEKLLLLEITGAETDSLSERALSKWPSFWIEAGYSALGDNFRELALEYAERALTVGTDSPEYFVNLAELFGALAQEEKRESCYNRAAAMETDDCSVVARIAGYYTEKDMFGRAVELLTGACGTDIQDETVAVELAEAYLFDGQLDSAESCLLQILDRNPSSVFALCYLGLIEEKRGNPVEAVDRYLSALRIEPGYSYAESRLRYIASDSYDPAYERSNTRFLNWSAWIDLSSTGGNIDEKYFGGGGSLEADYGTLGSSATLEVHFKTETKDDIEIRKTAWASVSAEHFLTNHLYAGASSSWDRQPITVRPWQVSSYLAGGWKSWPATWVWVAPETGIGLVNTRWNTDMGRTDELTAYISISSWFSTSVSFLPTLWLSGSLYVPPRDPEKLVSSAVGELKFDIPGGVSLVLGTTLDYTRTPVVESWEKLDSEMYIRLRI